MAVSWLTVYRAVLLCAVPVCLFVLYRATSHRETRGARPLALLVSGGLLYVVVKLAVVGLFDVDQKDGVIHPTEDGLVDSPRPATGPSRAVGVGITARILAHLAHSRTYGTHR
jgi:hypothetical protein